MIAEVAPFLPLERSFGSLGHMLGTAYETQRRTISSNGLSTMIRSYPNCNDAAIQPYQTVTEPGLQCRI